MFSIVLMNPKCEFIIVDADINGRYNNNNAGNQR